jgi:hypothetical protein
VSPNPATKADTFMPIVPSAVTKPKIIKPIFAVRPMSFSNSGFNPRLLANRVIKNWVKIPLIQNRINIATLAITAGKISKMFRYVVVTKVLQSINQLTSKQKMNPIIIGWFSFRNIGKNDRLSIVNP